MSDSVRPQRRQPTRLPRPWDSPGKNTGVGCHFLLQCMKVKGESEVAQSCPTLRDPMDCSLPHSSIQGIFQARVLEWGAISFSKIVHYLQWNRFWLSSQIKKKVRLNIPVSFSLFMSYFTPSLPPIPSFLSQHGDFFPGLKSYVFSLAAPFF